MTRAELVARHGTRKVKRIVAQDGAEPEVQEEIFRIASSNRKDWTNDDWLAMLRDLDACDLRLEDWLILR